MAPSDAHADVHMYMHEAHHGPFAVGDRQVHGIGTRRVERLFRCRGGGGFDARTSG